MSAILNALKAGFSSSTVLNQVKRHWPQAAHAINTAQNFGYSASNILKSLAKDNDNDADDYLTEYEQTIKRDKQQKRAAALGLVGAAGTVGAGIYGATKLLQQGQAVRPSAVLPAPRNPPGRPGATINVTPRPRGGPPGLPAPRQGLPAPRGGPKGGPKPNQPNNPPPQIRGQQASTPNAPVTVDAEDYLPDVPEINAVQHKQAAIGQMYDLATRGKTSGNPFLRAASKLIKSGTLTDVQNFGNFYNWWNSTDGEDRGNPLVEYEKFRVQTRGMFEPPAAQSDTPHVRKPSPQIQQPQPQQNIPQEEMQQPEMHEASQQEAQQPGVIERVQQAAFAERPELKQLLDRTFKGKEFSIPTYRLPGESAEDFHVRHTVDTAIKKAAEYIGKGESFLDYFEAERKEPGAEWMLKMPEHLKESGMFLSTADDILSFLAGAGGPLSGPYEKLLEDKEKEELMMGITDANVYGAQITPNMVWNFLVTIEPKLATIKEFPRIKGGRKEKIGFNVSNMGRFLTHAVYGVISGKNISPELADKIGKISRATHGLDVIAKAAHDGNFRKAMAEMERLSDDEAFMALFTDEVEQMVAQFGVKGMKPAKGSGADTRSANLIRKKFGKEEVPEEVPLGD